MSETAYLVADIGGTNARFAIVTGSAATGFAVEQPRRLKNEDFEDLRDAVHAYLESCEGKRPDRACFAVAGPIVPGKVKLTNSTWRFDPDALAADLGLESLLAVNDFAAQARGAPLVKPAERETLNAGEPMAGAPIAVHGPGTGLGLGLVIPAAGRMVIVATEGGHAGFAPRTEEEIAVGRFIADEYGYVSWERLLSGRGLVNIHRALCHLRGIAWPGHRPEDITREALADPASVCGDVVKLFCAALGAYAGDVAVMTGARGGVFIAGGIAPKVLPVLKTSAFLARFQRRGPMTRYAEAVPVHLVTTETAALIGAAAIAEAGGLA